MGTEELTKTPKISVVCSTYNRADYFLPRAIESVLKQTEQDFELLIIDDKSTDNTAEIVAPYMAKDLRVKYFPLPQHHGSDTKPKNWGCAMSRGEYIAYIDDDVEFTSYHLEVLLKAFTDDPALDVAFCESMLVEDGATKGKGICQCMIPDGLKWFNPQFLFTRNYIDTSQVMHKKDAVIDVGGWDEKLEKFVDWNLWVRMVKWGKKFVHVPVPAAYTYLHSDRKSVRVQTKSWFDGELGMTMFEPTFSASGCGIYLPYLAQINREFIRSREVQPKVGIYTITYNRLGYTKRMRKTLQLSTDYPFDWLVFDNGSKDGTLDFIRDETKYYSGSGENKGLSFASNWLLNKAKGKYDILIKVDNDCEFKTKGWLEDFVDLWRRNHLLYISPYVEGLIHNPGGAPRVGHSMIGDYYVEVSHHIGGICAFIDSKAYDNFRWTDEFMHGNQDREASIAFIKKGYMPMYLPKHRIMHMDGTDGQYKEYPEYFEKRKTEKTKKVDPGAYMSEDEYGKQ